MTLAQLEHAEQRMQQQWHDLVMAEQAGKPLEILEHMYDSYILLAEEYNACVQAYQSQRQSRRKAGTVRQQNSIANPTLPHKDKQQDAKKAS